MAANDNYSFLIAKLDRFIRKYYLNQIIRGALYATALILALFIAMTLLEHYFYFGTGMRKLLLFGFVACSGLALLFWVAIPLLHYFRLGKLFSHEQAAHIIGEHFQNVKDKLLNVLQLKKQSGTNQLALIDASIDQKTEDIKLVPFRSAINLGQNRKYLRYALPPLLLLFIILFAAPSIIQDSTRRLINNSTEFDRPAPFMFTVTNDELTVVQFENFLLDVTVDGEVLPNEVFIDIDDYQYRLTKQAPNRFTYQFSNVQKTTDFKLFSSNVHSKEYQLDVLKKPNILGFDLELDYPAYTARKDEKLANIGDIVVPAGTNLSWIFNASNTDDIVLHFSGQQETVSAKRIDNELFSSERRALRDELYRIFISNAHLPKADSVSYSISVIPDLYPTIRAEKFVDSTDAKLLFFVGDASDDYGLRSLSFNYRITPNKGAQGPLQSINLADPQGKQTQYDYTWDVNELDLKPGDEVAYYFEVFDNDAVNGSKSARTNLMIYEKPTVEEYEEQASKNNDDIKKDLQQSLIESRKIQEDMKKLREKLLQQKEVDWQTRKEFEKLLERQKELEKQMEQAKQNFEENLKNQEEFANPKEDIMEKQEQLQQLFEELMSDEMKELMEQIEELMQKLEKDGALEMMEEMEMSDEELEKELDRMLELFKQLELEYEMQQQIEKLEELAEEQEQLSEETEQENSNQEQKDLEKKQEEINEKFDKIQDKMEEIEQKNKELENPKDMGDSQEQMEDIDQDLQQSKEQLQQQQNKKASKSQKSAAQKMKKMAQDMAQQMQSASMEQMQEDMDAMRQLLENLVNMSFDQEDLMDIIANANVNTPRYVDLVQDQYKLKDDFKIIEDSLQALAKRVFQIESFVTEKVTEIKKNMKDGIDQLEERKKPQAGVNQQKVMKNVNDLALMLSEVLEQMQQQMANSMPGSQMCNKPGGKGGKGSVPKDKITNAQQQLGNQMKQMKEAMQKGQKMGSSKEFAQMAAKQAALRKALRELQQEKQQQGKGSKELQEIIDQMNKVETDLVNKRLNNETLKRQQEILTRLLEAEKADREREYDNKRKSEAAGEKERKMPPSLEEYIKKREAEIDMYKSVSPALKPYYKFLVEEYFKSLKQ